MRNELPKQIKTFLQSLDGFTAEGLIYYTGFDLGTDGDFQGGGVLLYENRLAVLRYNEPETAIVFAGYTASGSTRPPITDGRLEYFDMANMGQLQIEQQVVGGRLWAEVDGEAITLAIFSNLHGTAMHRLVRLFNKLRDGQAIGDGDFEDDFDRGTCPKCGTAYLDVGRKVCHHCLDTRTVFRRLMSFFSPYRARIVVMMICIIGTAGLSLAWPYLSGSALYDGVFKGTEHDNMLTKLGVLALVMIGAKLIGQLFGIIQGVIVATMVPDVIRRIKDAVFQAMGRLSLKFFTSKQTGTLMTRIINDSNEVTGFFIDGLPYLIINAIVIVATVSIMMVMNWRLGLVTIFLLPLITIISAKLGPRWHMLFQKRYRAVRAINSHINDNITGARVIKAFGRESQEIKRFDKYNRNLKSFEMDAVNFSNQFHMLFFLAENIILIVVWLIGALLVIGTDGMTYGMLATFLGYVAMLSGPLDFMSFIFRWWNYSLNCGSRIFEIIDAVPDIVEARDAIDLKRIEGSVEFKNVSFAYVPNKNALENISLQVNAGEMLGIVGQSGAGKSTLVSLISRLYDPYEGSVLIDGIDVRKLSFKSLYGCVSVVSQETFFFMGTVAENIAYALPCAEREDIIRAAKAAAAHDFIIRLPDGYDTVIGSGGRELSGGERQRLSIARAVLANPRILILDEATASVDTNTEQAIQRSLEWLIEGRTVISIAHRLSTLKNATRLIVLEDGKLTESGTHGELYEKDGQYRKLLDLQNTALAMRGIEDSEEEQNARKIRF